MKLVKKLVSCTPISQGLLLPDGRGSGGGSWSVKEFMRPVVKKNEGQFKTAGIGFDATDSGGH